MINQDIYNICSILSDIVDNRSCLEVFAQDKTIVENLYRVVSNPDCLQINFSETLSVITLLLKFCVFENYMLPNLTHKKQGKIFNIQMNLWSHLKR